VSVIVLTAIWGATQWTAWRLGYQPQLGTAWTEIAGMPVYEWGVQQLLAASDAADV
jgi:type IV secretion system protein VirD4